MALLRSLSRRVLPTIAADSLRFSGCEVVTLPFIAKRTYRGSNRDTRKRKWNQMVRINKELLERGLVEPRPSFNRQRFMLKHFEQESYCLQKRLGLCIENTSLLLSVFNCSSSYLPGVESNVKLALQGYYLTSLFVSDYLLREYPLLPQGLLTIFKDKIMGRNHVTDVAQNISLTDFILVDPDLSDLAKEKHLPYVKDDVISDCFFALVGAIYISENQEAVDRFLKDFLSATANLETLLESTEILKPRNTLVDICELAGLPPPRARVIHKLAETSSLPVYVVGIFSGKQQLGQSGGATVETAKEAAYLESIRRLLSYNSKELQMRMATSG